MAGAEIPLAFLREMCIITGYASEYGLVAQLGEQSPYIATLSRKNLAAKIFATGVAENFGKVVKTHLANSSTRQTTSYSGL